MNLRMLNERIHQFKPILNKWRIAVFNDIPNVLFLMKFTVFFILMLLMTLYVYDKFASQGAIDTQVLWLVIGLGFVLQIILGFAYCKYTTKKIIFHPGAIFLRFLLIKHEDKVIVDSRDERKTYTGRYIQLVNEELKLYLSTRKEKPVGYKPIKGLFSRNDRRELIDIGFGLYIRVPFEAIAKIEPSTDL
ncbi:MAG: hypothetical protein HKM04_09435 [Legionellales bacterium]|nr:hypothetical protein [Legionellales bacterium]